MGLMPQRRPDQPDNIQRLPTYRTHRCETAMKQAHRRATPARHGFGRVSDGE
jgi:hypothetical protein